MHRRLLAAFALIALAAGVFAQSDRTEWVVWTRSHHFPIASIAPTPRDDYADLQFLKEVLGDRRLVQLGESGHGVAEFDSVESPLDRVPARTDGIRRHRVRKLDLRVLHGEHGNVSSIDMLRGSIFGVWATEEVLPLFDYIKESQKTERPLTLAGFDTQISSGRGVLSRPAFFRRIVAAVDADYAEEVAAFDADFVGRAVRFDNSAFPPSDQQFYERLEGLPSRQPRIAGGRVSWRGRAA